MKFFPLYIFLFLFLAFPVFSIGMSPPSFQVDYTEGITHEFEVRVINNGAPDTYVSIDLFGELAEYFTVSETEFQFKPGEQVHAVTLTANLPNYDELLLFGKQRILFYVSEGKIDNTGTMGFSTSVKGIIIIDIPVPGKLGLINSFEVKNTNEGFIAPFTLELKNRGEDDLNKVSARIVISDFRGNQLDTLNFNNINMGFDETYIIEDVLPTASYDSSKYFATAFFTYDLTKATLSKDTSFFVGSTDVELLSYTKNVTSDTINKVSFELQSLWGSPLKNIRGSIEVNGVSQRLPVLDFEPFENKQLDAFLDIPILNETSISAKLILDIPVDAQNTVQKEFSLTFDVVEKIDPNTESPFGESSFMLIGIILIVLLLVGVNVFIFMKRKK